MNPYLTSAGRALLVAAALFVFIGAVATQWVLLLIGAVLMLVLGMSYQGLLPAALALERRLLTMEVQPPDGAEVGTLRTGHPVQLSLRVRNRAGATLRGVELIPHTGSGLELAIPVPVDLHLPGYSAVETDLSLKARLTGRWMLHGFKVRVRDALGLVAVGEYVATPTALKFMPEVAGGFRGGLVHKRQRVQDREGLHMVRQRGFGTDLRELRDHQHGDPFRAIAWKATARTGRLKVKDYESEMVLGSYLCLDISSTMRGGGQGGALGPNKLEHAISLASAWSDHVSSTNDRLGLVTFDEKIHGHLKPRDGRAHTRQLIQHLIGVRHVVDEELTEYTELEVAELVSRYLLIHERLDFRRQAVRRREAARGELSDGRWGEFSSEAGHIDSNAFDLDLLVEWVRASLREEQRRFDDPALHAGVLGYKRTTALRRFAHLRGLEIPYRVETRLGQKERGLVQCFEEIMAHTRESHLILVVSDLCGIMNTELIVRGLRLAQARRHRVAFIAPFTPEYVEPHDQPRSRGRGAVLHDLFTRAEIEERQAVIKAIEGLGIPVVQIGPGETLPAVIRQLSSLMRRR